MTTDEGGRNRTSPHILIFTPTWVDEATGEDAVAPECEASIKSQALRGGEFDWHVTTDNPFPIGNHGNVLHQYQQAREYFLLGRWDALLTVEHDNVLPDSGAVQRLLDTPGDVIYAPYRLRHGNPVLSTWQYIGDRNLGMSLSNYKNELDAARRAVIYRVCGVGMGCTLFWRNVVERIPFEGTTARNASPDLHFARVALQQGWKSFGRFDVPVLHYSEGHWLHPYRNEGINMRYLALQTINIMVNSNAVKLVEGQEIELDPEPAQEWMRAGYLTPIGVPAPAEPAQSAIEAAVVEPLETADAPAQLKKRKRKAGVA
jgi:hypothetical protein